MKGYDKALTKEQLVDELVHMCQRIVELEASETTRQHNRALNLLNQAGQGFTATLDLEQITDQLLPAATEIIGAEGASIWLQEGVSDSGWLVCRSAYHHGQTRPPVDLRLRPGEGIAGWVAQNQESIVVPSVQDDPRFFPGIDEQIGFHTLSLLAVPLWMHDQVIGVLEVVNKKAGDFTWDDRVQAETLAASASIAIENARLTDALHQQSIDLQHSHERLNSFVQALTGDIWEPVRLIIVLTQMLQEDHATLPDEKLHDYLHTISMKGRKIADVIDELLATQTTLPPEADAEITPLDMGNIVDAVLERLVYLIEQHQAEIILPKSWPVALGYAPWVEEVWANYINNGIKYGGRPPRVELGFDEDDSSIYFWVRDNGPGLSPEAQMKLFAPTTQRERVHNTQYGLGLALAQSLVEKLGGQVGVESEVGQGSFFFFTLPVAK